MKEVNILQFHVFCFRHFLICIKIISNLFQLTIIKKNLNLEKKCVNVIVYVMLFAQLFTLIYGRFTPCVEA